MSCSECLDLSSSELTPSAPLTAVLVLIGGISAETRSYRYERELERVSKSEELGRAEDAVQALRRECYRSMTLLIIADQRAADPTDCWIQVW